MPRIYKPPHYKLKPLKLLPGDSDRYLRNAALASTMYFSPGDDDAAQLAGYSSAKDAFITEYDPYMSSTRSYKPTFDGSKEGQAKRRAEALAKQAANRAVQQALNRQGRPSGVVRRSGERNYVDVARAQYQCDTTGSITLLNTVAQGASVSQRIGKKWYMKSIQTHGFVQNGSTAISNLAAWMIVYDKRPTGSLPAITDILVTANSQAFNNDVNAGRFKIIRRWEQYLAGSTLAASAGGDTGCEASEYIKINLPVVNKAAGTGAIGDIEEGALYLVTVGNTAAGTAAASLDTGFRLRFVDM